ncbi:hypothetical protein [Nocardia sp. CA-119907]|uniref:hypothetical protein n=1 Tax=Nocardia sp. CA-119907 TaxID=3239973 RepID=UPI003D96A23A
MADDHWGAADPTVPVLLLPVRIETRSTADRAALRVRIYPDDIHARAGEADVRTALLPDCFRVVAVQGDARSTKVGEPIDPRGVALGPGSAPENLGALVDGLRGAPGVAPDPELAWLTEYKAAEDAGMAVTVRLEKPDVRVDRLFVLGIRTGVDPADAAAQFGALIRAHAEHDGAGFVPAGTATNNTASARSAWSRPLVPTNPSHTPRPAAVAGSNAEVLAAAFDLDPTLLTDLDHAQDTDQLSAAAFATALWPVTWETALEKLLAPTAKGAVISARARRELREHALESVRGRGPLPTLRIGKQPYGILPVSASNRWRPKGSGTVEGPLARFLARIRPLWSAGAAKVPTIASGDLERDLPLILGQSAVSRALRVRSVLDATTAATVADALGTGRNTLIQQVLSNALAAVTGAGPAALRPPDLLGRTARILALPLAHDTDPAFCAALLASAPLPEGASVLQALLALAEARARHEVEQLLAQERLWRLRGWLSDATALLPDEVIQAGTDALDRLGGHAWDDPTPFRRAATGIERSVGAFDILRHRALFPLAASRPHYADTVRTAETGARGAAEAARAGQRLAELRTAIARIRTITDTPTRALLLSETLDCASHRLDAWRTSVVTNRLTTARKAGVRGLAVGAYGWVENIEIAPPHPVHDPVAGVDATVFDACRDGGYIVAPSPAHAATAAVLRGARLTHDPGDTGDAALDIDLSSTRVRAALGVLDGVRAGQPLGALLGYRLERWLHDTVAAGHRLDRFIYCLRSLAPIVTAKSTDRAVGAVPTTLESIAAAEVVDGVRLLEIQRADPTLITARLGQPPAAYAAYLEKWPAPTDDEVTAVLAAIKRLDRLHDAVADLLLAESVHQLVLGSPARSAAAMDALAGDGLPPEPEVIRTPRSGVALSHRVVVLLPPPAPAVGWASTARSDTHPALAAYAAAAFGPPTRIVLAVDEFGTPTATFAAAALSALDLVVASDGGAADPAAFWALLRRRVPAFATIEQPILIRPAGLAPELLTFGEAWALAGSLYAAITSSRALTPTDLVRAGDVGTVATRVIDRGDLRQRANAAVSGLRKVIDTPAEPLARADAYTAFGLGTPITGAIPTDTELSEHVAALTAAANQRHATAVAALAAYDATPPAADTDAVAALTEVMSVVLGDRLPTLPVCLAAADAFATALNNGTPVVTEARKVTDGRDIRPWLTRAARVRPAVGRFAETILLREALGRPVALRTAQLPGGGFGTWIGLPFSTAAAPEQPVTGWVVEVPAGLAATGTISGMMVDEWAEVVPLRRPVRDPVDGTPTGELREIGTAGIAVNANGPNARAPQALLLAVNPTTEPWTPQTVVDVLDDTLASARERAVTLERLPLAARLLPATYVQDWSLQGEPVLDLRAIMADPAVRAAILTHVAEKE